MTTKTRDQEIQILKEFLLQKGVEPFWVSSALGWIRRGMAGNTHWATDLRHPKVKVNKEFKCVDSLTVRCTLHSVSDTVPGQIRYEHKNGHKVIVKAI